MSTPIPSPSPRQVPWYREPWPWLLMAGPAIVVVAGFATLWIAIQSDDGVIADDYYKRGLVINRVLEREERAAALRIAADLALDGDGAVRLEVAAVAGAELPETLKLRLTHATRAGMDRSALLQRVAEGAYRGRVDFPPEGRWLIVVEGDDWRLPTVEVTGQPRSVRLGTPSRAP